jgi:hypothetical protein
MTIHQYTFADQFDIHRDPDHQKVNLLDLLHNLSQEDVKFLVEQGQKVLEPLGSEDCKKIDDCARLEFDSAQRHGRVYLNVFCRRLSYITNVPAYKIRNYISGDTRYKLASNNGKDSLVNWVPAQLDPIA